MTIDLLELEASKLAPLTDELVFVGGATIALWITNPAAPPTRATGDVDLICDAISYIEYAALSARMRALSFSEDEASGVICRWQHPDGLVVDLMPQSEEVLGFHDIVVLLNGRPELLGEIAELPKLVRADLQAAIAALLDDPYFQYVITDAVSSYGQAAGGRETLVRERAQQLATATD